MLAPYWKSAVVDVPCAFTVPLSVTELVVTLVAEPVLTVGIHRVPENEPIAYPSPLPPVYWAKSIRPHTMLVTIDTINTVTILHFIFDPPCYGP
ncbi:MAG: hypothetical protein Q7J76_01090 [Candidatus Brocadiaceae bacterium]|nr:hypothetical protein [Candidatus Brocadiaceae bacterium]